MESFHDIGSYGYDFLAIVKEKLEASSTEEILEWSCGEVHCCNDVTFWFAE